MRNGLVSAYRAGAWAFTFLASPLLIVQWHLISQRVPSLRVELPCLYAVGSALPRTTHSARERLRCSMGHYELVTNRPLGGGASGACQPDQLTPISWSHEHRPDRS